MLALIKCWDDWYTVQIEYINTEKIEGKFAVGFTDKIVLHGLTGTFPWKHISQIIII